MEYRALGGSGLHVSRIGLGTMAWGRDVEWPVVRELVHDFVEGGGNLIDTAPAYGGGVAEQMIGKLLATGIPRDSWPSPPRPVSSSGVGEGSSTPPGRRC